MNAIYSFYIKGLKHLFSSYAFFVFYINKMFIRLNKAKILRSASCLLFLLILNDPVTFPWTFCSLCRSHKANPLQPSHTHGLPQLTISCSLFQKAITEVQTFEMQRMLSVAHPLSQGPGTMSLARCPCASPGHHLSLSPRSPQPPSAM